MKKLLVLLATLLALAGSAMGYTNCSNAVSVGNQTVVLDTDLNCTNGTQVVFDITGDNVTLDCDGHQLVCDGCKGLLYVNGNNIEVRDCDLLSVYTTNTPAMFYGYDRVNLTLFNNTMTCYNGFTNNNGCFAVDAGSYPDNDDYFNFTLNTIKFYSMYALTSGTAPHGRLLMSNNYIEYNHTGGYQGAFFYTSHNPDISNHTSIGNFWNTTSYSCTDNDSDGLCDSPFLDIDNYIPAPGVGTVNDYHPLSSFPYVPCTLNWTCSGYGDCNTSDLAPCNETVDGNACGEAYSGDYSEFSPQACDYCTEDIQEFQSFGECLLPQEEQSVLTYYIDSEYGVCCAVTAFPSDCHIDNGSYDNSTGTQSCHARYTESDVKDVIIDGMGTAGAAAVSYVEIIVLLLIVSVVVGAVVTISMRFKR